MHQFHINEVIYFGWKWKSAGWSWCFWYCKDCVVVVEEMEERGVDEREAAGDPAWMEEKREEELLVARFHVIYPL
jgi:hypothetical protein